MTYSEKVPVMVGSKIIDQVMGMMTKWELVRATMTWRQTNFGAVTSGSLQLPCTNSKEDRSGVEVTPSPSSDPAASRGFCLDGVRGPVCTTQKITIPQFGTVSIHGHTGVWGHCMRVNVLAEPAQSPQLPVSVIPTTTYGESHPGSSRVLTCLRNFECPPLRGPCQGHSWPGCSCKSGTPSGPPSRDLRWVHLWLKEGMDPESIESPRPRAVAWGRACTGQGAATQMGAPICLQQPGPGQNLLDQASDWVDTSDTLQEALPCITPHMYNNVKAHLQEMLDIGAIRKSHSPWASTVVLVCKKDGSLRFCIDLRKLNNQTIKDAYSLTHIEETLMACRDCNGSPHSTWSLGTDRSRWMRRASHWPCSP